MIFDETKYYDNYKKADLLIEIEKNDFVKLIVYDFRIAVQE